MALSQLHTSDFSKYPPRAKEVAVSHLELLQKLPPAFAGILLREVINYDWRFPAEQTEIDGQLRFLGSLSEDKLQTALAGFAALPIPTSLEGSHWGAAPVEFTEKLTAQLWATHQMEHFRDAAETYQQALRAAIPEEMPATPRLCIVVVGREASPGQIKVFQKLRAHGTYFTQVKPAGALNTLFAAANERAQSQPSPYAHWYVDGGQASPLAASNLTTVSYVALDPVREALLHKVDTMKSSGGVVGPEDLRSLLAQLRPDQLGSAETSRDPVLRNFELNLLTEGSGTQIFSTTFVQWAAREILRRARPLSLMIRFAPRQVQRPMNEMLAATRKPVEYDPAGSLVDADMGAFYTWINLMRLSGAETSRFVAWFEDQQEAIAIAPTMAKGTVSAAPCSLTQILNWSA